MRLERSRVGVRVAKSGRKDYKLMENDTIIMVKPETEFIPLEKAHPNTNILGIDDGKIEPAGRFYISAETIDPYRIIIDWF